MSFLQDNIRQYMQDKGLGVAELERKSGLKPNAVRNILSGHSKRPSAQMLLSISRVFGCSIVDVLGEPEADSLLLVSDNAFYVNITGAISRIIEDNYSDKRVSFYDMAEFIKEIYQYSLRSTYPNPDLNFAGWFIMQELGKRS